MEKNRKYSYLTLTHFECFIKVAELGTTLKASEALNISQPLVSQKISQLESAIDIQLFTRVKRYLELTEEGETFLDEIKQLSEHLDNTIVSLKQQQGTTSQKTLTIGFSDGQETTEINRLRYAVEKKFPDITFKIEIENRMQLTSQLLSGEIDICCIIDTEQLHANKNIGYRTISDFPIKCLVHKDSPLAKKGTLEWNDLDNCKICLPESLKNTRNEKDLKNICKKYGIHVSWEYRAVDFYTLRKYLNDTNCCIMTFIDSVEDPTLKLLPLGGLSYPAIVAWKKSNLPQVERYINELTTFARQNNIYT